MIKVSDCLARERHKHLQPRPQASATMGLQSRSIRLLSRKAQMSSFQPIPRFSCASMRNFNRRVSRVSQLSQSPRISTRRSRFCSIRLHNEKRGTGGSAIGHPCLRNTNHFSRPRYCLRSGIRARLTNGDKTLAWICQTRPPVMAPFRRSPARPFPALPHHRPGALPLGSP